MPTPIKTQCPNCDSTFDVPKALFNDADTKGRCPLCKQTFFVNQHLSGSANQHTNQNISRASEASAHPAKESRRQTQAVDTLADDVLIHDDMEIDDDDVTEEISADYADLEAMQAWLTDDNIHQPTHKSAPKSPQEIAAKIQDTDYLPPSDQIKPNANTQSHHKTTSLPASNPTASSEANWLEKMLEEKSGNIADSDAEADAEADLSQLLAEASNSEPNSQPQQILIQPNAKARMPMAQSNIQTSIASLLWLAGCLVLMLLLFAQYVTFNLDTLIKNPMYADRLQSVCAISACSLPQANLDAFEISDIDVKPSQIKTGLGASDIQATLINQSSQAQLFPSLKVSIYDASNTDNLLGEFIASPTEYLLSPQRQLAGQYGQPVLFTIPLAARQIHHVTITPIY